MKGRAAGHAVRPRFFFDFGGLSLPKPTLRYFPSPQVVLYYKERTYELAGTHAPPGPGGCFLKGATSHEHFGRKNRREDSRGGHGIVTRNSFCDICAPGPHCGVTCYVKDGKIIKVEGTDGHPTNHGLLCPRGQSNRQYVYRKDRVRTPLAPGGPAGRGQIRAHLLGQGPGRDRVPGLNQVKADYGPSSVAFYSGYNKWYRPFLQRLCYDFGSVNYGTESSSCFTSTIISWRVAAGESFVGPDLGRAGVFLGWCYNAYYSAYLMAGGVEKARARGMKVIIVDPRITPAVEKQCDLYLRIKPGTDSALALCLGRELIVNDWVDHDYIRDNVYGYEQYKNYVMDFTPEKVEKITDVPADQIRLAARMIHEHMPLAINQSGAALVHHTNGMQTHRRSWLWSAIMGTYDRPGGMIPSR